MLESECAGFPKALNPKLWRAIDSGIDEEAPLLPPPHAVKSATLRHAPTM
jgi:hypothetical protein